MRATDLDTPLDCSTDPSDSLKRMFVDIVQRRRIDAGERPALRAVFQKVHGGAHGVLRMRPDLPESLRVGLFSLDEVAAWVRFSSDTDPRRPDYLSTLGVAVKLFGVPGEKLVGDPGDTTMDLLFQNHDVFFVATAVDMCEMIHAGVVGGDYQPYLDSHPTTAAILGAMAKPVASVLAEPFWSLLPFQLGERRVVKYTLRPTLDVAHLSEAPPDRDHLRTDLVARLGDAPASFTLLVQCQTDEGSMPIDDATVRWDEALSPPIAVADLLLPKQDVMAAGQPEFVENLAFSIWRVPDEHRPLGSVAHARRYAYLGSAEQRRRVNGVPQHEPVTTL